MVQETTTSRDINQGTCRRQPDIILSHGHFNQCIGLNVTAEYSFIKLHYHTSSPKIKKFPVTFQGPGLNCRSASGILLFVVSINGSSVQCNPWSDLLNNGVVRCTYRCKCPDVCSVLEAYIDTRSPVSVCEIFAWCILVRICFISIPWICKNYKHMIDLLHKLRAVLETCHHAVMSSREL